jgi:4-hydroxythreonine-4-phosphate dehydrogenase
LSKPRLLISAGEPAGIGLDIICELTSTAIHAELVVIADQDSLQARAKQLKKAITFVPFQIDQTTTHQAHQLVVHHMALPEPCYPGVLTPTNSQFQLTVLQTATRLCLNNRFDALVTAPVNKAAINQAGSAFSGHTEYLQQLCKSPQSLMVFVADDLKVALATTHCPLSQVPQLITQSKLIEQITLLHQAMQRYFIAQPQIAVCGLNPHAGEGGYIGQEEIQTITPAIQACQQRGIMVTGPYSADTVFTQKFDAILAMYHDQALPVVKALSFGNAVNVTFGLPFIRTSVDHGTALSLAGSGQANADSLIAAVNLAEKMVKTRAQA